MGHCKLFTKQIHSTKKQLQLKNSSEHWEYYILEVIKVGKPLKKWKNKFLVDFETKQKKNSLFQCL